MSSTRPEIEIHPRSHSISAITNFEWDVVIIGAGPSGETAAIRCASNGQSVLLVEKELTGGECGNWACVPSKALLRPLEIAAEAQLVGGVREKLLSATSASGTRSKVDLSGLWAYRDESTVQWNDHANISGLESAGITLVRGSASLDGPRRIKICDWHSGTSISVGASFVIIATGSEPDIPKISGLTQSGYWTPREAVSAHHALGHLIILGAGPVGTEMATIYAGIGTHVTLITTKSRILVGVVEEAARRVHESLVRMGVDVKVDCTTKEVVRAGNHIRVTTADDIDIDGDEILVAAGRRPRTSGIGLETVMNLPDQTGLHVDQFMRVANVPEGWLYSIGDSSGIANTTHMGMYQATICAQHLLQQRQDEANSKPLTFRSGALVQGPVPQICFTDPQIAWVGMSLLAAREKELSAKEVSVSTGGPGTHTYLHGEGYEGWAQWIIEIESGKLLGAVFVGQGVADLLHASTVAIVGGMSWQQLVHAVPSFPTLSEAYQLLIQKCLTEL